LHIVLALHRFPFFLLAQENKLKVALLDYLRRQHPDDTDKYSMVAHHFSMYREIAQTLEETAMRQLASLGDCFPGTMLKLLFVCLFVCLHVLWNSFPADLG